MKLRCVFAVLALCCSVGGFAQEPVSLSGKMISCGKCHVGKLALTGKPVDEVLAGLHRIREGKRPHPPGMQVFEAGQLAEVAAILSGEPSAKPPH